jgi:hypothetical protein
VVGAKEQSLSVTFETDDDLQPGDQFVIELPKWNPESRFTKPRIRQEDENRLYCQGILNTKAEIECEITYGTDRDVVTLTSPL